MGHFRVAYSLFFQSEAKCEAIEMKMTFILIQIKLIFTSLVLKVRLFGTRKWPISKNPIHQYNIMSCNGEI